MSPATMSTRTLSVYGQKFRVDVRPGDGTRTPLVLCCGIGASFEVLQPFVDALDPAIEVIRFDVPGVGGSPAGPVPYRFPQLAWLLSRTLDQLGHRKVAVLGLSWGGALAQQFAFQNPVRCRRLILVATATGAVMVPGKPSALAKMLSRRRFLDHDHVAAIAGDLYGGAARADPSAVKRLFDRKLTGGARTGYVYQLLAGSVWTSVFALPLIRQDTLIVAGTDDPIIPVANARIMAALLPHATLHLHPGGHTDLVTNAAVLAPVIEAFRGYDRPTRR
jgi:poly(3-hydroxyalkanoate) depolymerase